MNETQEFEFLKEKIKEKPVNKKKLLRRTIITVSMAVIFGLVACITFLVLEPVFNNWIYPEEKAQIITFPEEKDEIMPEDMVLEDPNVEIEEITESVIEKIGLEVEDYQSLYTKLYEVSKDAAKSVVTVTGVTSDVDWFDNTYESKGQTSGFIVADNGKELIIIVDKKAIEKAERIRITFCDGAQVNATIKGENENIGLVALTVPLADIKKETKEVISIAALGVSNGNSLLGSPIIALGSPLGYSNSISYGMFTSIGNGIHLVDSNYKLLTTDIIGSSDASGVIINLRGQVIGIIQQTYNDSDKKNIVSAIGITELKPMIAKISNGQEFAYLGIHPIDVTKEAQEELKVPMGAYVAEIEMDSPAMKAGIQGGDVIVKINDTYVDNSADYVSVLNGLKPGEYAALTIMRQAQQGYQQLQLSIAINKLK